MIEIKLAKTEFQPGESIVGSLTWDKLDGITAIDVRLIWFTEGKGTRDVLVAEVDRVASPKQSGSHRFKFLGPKWPHSFSGQLISLRWAIEAVQLPSEDATILELTISPSGKEILLPTISKSSTPVDIVSSTESRK